MTDVPSVVSWFRTPSGEDPGTLNACYHALDLPVIRGRADELALDLDGRPRTFAWMLTEVGACAGVLRAFGVDVGTPVVVDVLPAETAVVLALAVARVGGVATYDDTAGVGPAGVEASVAVRGLDGDVVFSADDQDVPWDVAMRAGRTDPAGCADVPGDAVLARHGSDELAVLDALGSHEVATPAGLDVVEVGGVRLWTSVPAV